MHRLATSLVALGLITACAGQPKTATTESSAPAPDVDEHAFFDAGGQAASFEAFAASIADVDFVAFGELHDHPVAARYELALLEAMLAQERPVALAMEFFEADHQAALDEYLAGTLDEATFRERTGRTPAYDASHRPLIELCKAKRIPVIAANAPRRLVTAYRKSDAASYEAWLASLTEDERGFMPRSSVPPDDEFKQRFMTLMGPKRGPAFYRSMALWNDAMAESAADFRAEHPEHRVLLVVGGFHVAKRLGTITQYLARRPEDTAKVLLMQATDGELAWSEQDRDEGDLIVKVRG